MSIEERVSNEWSEWRSEQKRGGSIDSTDGTASSHGFVCGVGGHLIYLGDIIDSVFSYQVVK